MKKIIFSYLIYSILASVFAQAARNVEFRVITFERVGDAKVLQLLDGNKVTDIKMHKNNFSGPYKSKGRTLRFYNSETDLKGKKKKNKPVPDAQVTIPNALGSKVILIAVPDNGKYKLFPIKDNSQKFLKGEITMINLTDSSVNVSLNKEEAEISPEGVHVWKNISPEKEAHEYPVKFYLIKDTNKELEDSKEKDAEEKDGEKKDGEKKDGNEEEKKHELFSSNYWRLSPDVKKYTLIYYSDPETKRIKITSISDH